MTKPFDKSVDTKNRHSALAFVLVMLFFATPGRTQSLRREPQRTPPRSSTHAAAAQNATKRDDIAAIRAIAERYVAAARQGRSAIFEHDLLPATRIQGYENGKLVDMTSKEFLADIDHSGPAKGLKAEVESIEVIGTAASLRIDCENWLGVHYSDFMNLLKVDGTWKVMGKVFDAHENR